MLFVGHNLFSSKRKKKYCLSLLDILFWLRCNKTFCNRRVSVTILIQSFLLLSNNTYRGHSGAKIRSDFELSCVPLKQLKEFLVYMCTCNMYVSVLQQRGKLNKVRTVDLQAQTYFAFFQFLMERSMSEFGKNQGTHLIFALINIVTWHTVS